MSRHQWPSRDSSPGAGPAGAVGHRTHAATREPRAACRCGSVVPREMVCNIAPAALESHYTMITTSPRRYTGIGRLVLYRVHYRS